MAFKLHIHDRPWRDLLKTARSLKRADAHARVGVMSGQTGEDGQAGDTERDGLTNAMLGAIHEFGTSDGRIPERSFIRSTIHAKRDEYIALLKKLVRGIYEQKIEPEKALAILGMKAETDIKRRIQEGEIKQDLADSTRERKEALTRKGSTGTVKALIDTGRLVASITHVVMMQGGAGISGDVVAR